MELAVAILLGIIAGICTGICPGIHINLVSAVLIVNFVFLNQYFSIFALVVFIITMGLVHCFLDFIPSILFGIPSPDTTLSLLPSQKMVLEGKAYEALYLSSLSSLYGTYFAIIISPILYFTLSFLYEKIRFIIPYLLVCVVFLFIILEKKNRILALVIVLFSSALGLLVLNTYTTDQSLLLLFTGLFGIASIVTSILEEQNEYPKQSFDINFKKDRDFYRSVSIGGLSSTICSIAPGIGNAQAASLSALMFKDLKEKSYLIVTGAIATINFIVSIITLYLLDKARNGAVFAVAQIYDSFTFHDLVIIYIVILIVSIIGFYLTMYMGKRSILIIGKLNFKMINYFLLIFLFILIFFMAGPLGILIMICAASLGLLCLNLGLARIHLMSVLLVPVILNLL